MNADDWPCSTGRAAASRVGVFLYPLASISISNGSADHTVPTLAMSRVIVATAFGFLKAW